MLFIFILSVEIYETKKWALEKKREWMNENVGAIEGIDSTCYNSKNSDTTVSVLTFLFEFLNLFHFIVQR